MTRITKDDCFMGIARLIGRRSLCSSRKVGAVIVNRGNIVSTGYNGPSSTFDHNERECIDWCERQQRREAGCSDSYGLNCPSVHAEANAFIRSNFFLADGGTLYVTSLPCSDCAKLISNAGIVRVVIDPADNVRFEAEDTHRIESFLKSNGVKVEFFGGEGD